MPPNTLIKLYTGRLVSPFELHPEDVTLDDIAHSLSLQCRFNGHCIKFYSVAQHSVHVAERVMSRHATRDVILMALFHDAAEAYLSDVAAPLKHTPAFEAYRALEYQIHRTIARAIGFSPSPHRLIKEADLELLYLEGEQLMGGISAEWDIPDSAKQYSRLISPLGPVEAEQLFRRFYHEISR